MVPPAAQRDRYDRNSQRHQECHADRQDLRAADNVQNQIGDPAHKDPVDTIKRGDAPADAAHEPRDPVRKVQTDYIPEPEHSDRQAHTDKHIERAHMVIAVLPRSEHAPFIANADR